jgi:hypothetical protein
VLKLARKGESVMFRSMSIAMLAVSVMGTARSQELNRSTVISLNETKKTLRNVLRQFELQGHVMFDVKTIVPSQEKLLAREISIQCEKKPFWEAVALVADAAGLQVDSFERPSVVLKKRHAFPFPNDPVQVAEPVTQGAFQARLEKHGIFDQLDVIVRPEPWVGQPFVVDYEAKVHFENGQSIRYEPDYLIWVYRLSDEVCLRIEMDDWPKGIAVRTVDVIAHLQVGIDWKPMTLPPISQIASREIKANDGVIRIKTAGFEEKAKSKVDKYGVRLRLEGVGLASKELGQERVRLLSPAGSSILPHKLGVSRGETENIQWTLIDVGFTSEQIAEDFEKYSLALLLEDGTKKVIGPIGEISPTIVNAGSSQLAISTSQLLAGHVELLNYGVRIPWDRIRLDVGQEATLEPQGHSRSGIYPHAMTFEFETDPIRTPGSQWKLVVEAPAKSVDHMLTLTFDDVDIPNE